MLLLHKASVITSEKEVIGSVLIDGEQISEVFYPDTNGFVRVNGQIVKYDDLPEHLPHADVWNLEGKCLIAGGIDAHVHFREPGLTHKADIFTESKAAAAGGVTTVMDMPNTNPATTDSESLDAKISAAEGRSFVNIGFHIGATNSNLEEIKTIVSEGKAKGVKVFMGSSTGNMLVDENRTLETLFSIKNTPVLVHCEDEATIKANLADAISRFGEDIPFSEHENIRSRKACIKSSVKALELAIQKGTKLTLCHISTAEELNMVQAAKSNNPGITAETSCNYLWFTNEDYKTLGSKVKCNPSVKSIKDRTLLREALRNGGIDTIGSDHAPHLLDEKDRKYCSSPSGLPSIQQSLPVLVTIAQAEDIPMTRIASVFSEKASEIYGLNRGKISVGYAADLVIFDKNREFIVSDEDQYSKCGWSPYTGTRLKGYVETVLVNGEVTVENGEITGNPHGKVI